MSNLQYFTYPGFGEKLRDMHNYNIAVRIGDQIQISGQGGWDITTGAMRENLKDEVDQVFANVELALTTAGGKGWSQVFKINLYITDMNSSEELIGLFLENMKKYMPDHKPILTAVGVAALAFPGMHLEAEVCAYDPEGAEEAKKA